MSTTSFGTPTGGGLEQDINTPQYHLDPSNYFQSGIPTMGTPSHLAGSTMQQPNPASIIPVVSEYFEWDLVNMWNCDFTQDATRNL